MAGLDVAKNDKQVFRVSWERNTTMKACTQGFNPDYSQDGPTIEAVQSVDGFAVIEFGAPWCEHCQTAQRAIQSALAPMKIPHIKVFDGRGKRLGRHFKVKRWPTLILLHSGTEVGRLVRPVQKNQVSHFVEPVFTRLNP